MYSGLDTDLREYEELCEHFGMGVAYNPWMPLEEVARISQTSWFGILSKVEENNPTKILLRLRDLH